MFRTCTYLLLVLVFDVRSQIRFSRPLHPNFAPLNRQTRQTLHIHIYIYVNVFIRPRYRNQRCRRFSPTAKCWLGTG